MVFQPADIMITVYLAANDGYWRTMHLGLKRDSNLEQMTLSARLDDRCCFHTVLHGPNYCFSAFVIVLQVLCYCILQDIHYIRKGLSKFPP